MKYIVDTSIANTRIDKLVEINLKDMGFKQTTRSMIKEDITHGVLVNGNSTKGSYKVKEGDDIEIDKAYWEKFFEEKDLSDEIVPQKYDLEILYEDKYLLVIKKPSNMVVHPGVGNRDNTLANYIRYYLESKDEYDINVDRSGLVHRLDRGVSGIMVIAKTKEVQEKLKQQFTEHEVEKMYIAQTEQFKPSKLDSVKEDEWFKIEGYVGRDKNNRYRMSFREYEFSGSKSAISYIKILDENKYLVKIVTGRMHQIRATLAYLGRNIVGDNLYKPGSKNFESNDIMLESVYLSFTHPITEERMEFNTHKI